MNTHDPSAIPLIFGSLLPTLVLIMVSSFVGWICERKFQQPINPYGANRKIVVRWSIMAGLAIFLFALFPLPFDIATMVLALLFSLATATITFYSRNMPGTAVLSVGLIGGIVSAGIAFNILINGAQSQSQQFLTVFTIWPILAGPALIASIIAATLRASAASTAY